jgi:hypothetical protein
MKRLIARLALVVGIATAALLFTTGGGSGVEAAAYPYCGPATGPCYGYAGLAGYPPSVGYTNYAVYSPLIYQGGYFPFYTNTFAARGCALGNYTCLYNAGFTPYWWYR